MNIFRALLIGLGLSLASGSALAGSVDLEREMEEARHQLDAAAQRIKELYLQKYGAGHEGRKAMLGILLGEGDSKQGVEIVGVTPGGGAEAAGLQAGDIIVRAGETNLAAGDSPMRELVKFMREVNPGDVVPVVYERGGETLNVDITTQAHGLQVLKIFDQDADVDIDLSGLESLAHMPTISHEAVPRLHGMRWLLEVDGDLAEYFGVKQGVIVLRPPQDSQLKGGDVLLQIDGESVTDAEQATRMLATVTETAKVRVQRKGREHTVQVQADEVSQSDVRIKRVIRIKQSDADADETVVEISD